MSLLTATLAIQKELKKVTNFNDPVLGIPDEGDRTSSKRMYIGEPEETFEYEDLHAAEGPTSSVAEISIVMTFHQEDVLPKNTPLYQYLETKATDVRTLIQAGNMPVTGAFKSDGDVGFRAQVQTVRYSFRPNDPIAAILITIILQAYTKN